MLHVLFRYLSTSTNVKRWPASLTVLLILLFAPGIVAAQSDVGSGISGIVTLDGNSFADVLISVTGTMEKTGSTNERDGMFIVILTAGNYTVTPSKEGYTFEPFQRTVDVADTVVAGVDFVASLAVEPTPTPATTPTPPPTPTPTPNCEDDSDNDNDGTPDCADDCPSDPLKLSPGICGCGISDADTDGDSVADCLYNDTPLGCGEEPTVIIGERLVTDNQELADLTLFDIRRLKNLIDAVSKRYGGKEGARLKRFARSYKKAVVKVGARTLTLLESLPTVLVPCAGQSGHAEVSNLAAKTEMRANTDDLRRISVRVLARLAFYQLVRYPISRPSAGKIEKIKAARKATKTQIAEIYGRINVLIDKVPDMTIVDG